MSDDIMSVIFIEYPGYYISICSCFFTLSIFALLLYIDLIKGNGGTGMCLTLNPPFTTKFVCFCHLL